MSGIFLEEASYDFVLGVYESFFNGQAVSNIIVICKTFAIAFFVLNVYNGLFEKMGFQYGAQESKMPFNLNKLLGSLLMVLLILSYNNILDFLDHILIGIDQIFKEPEKLLSENILETKPKEEIESTTIGAILKQAASIIIDRAIDPTLLALDVMNFLVGIGNSLIYFVFLMERFFILGILKILGPFALALAVFKRKYFEQWLKVYFSIFLLIIPFSLCIAFSDHTINGYMKQFPNMIGKGYTGTIVQAALFWFKLRILKKSYDIVYKVFT